jgi:hypothetical protein
LSSHADTTNFQSRQLSGYLIQRLIHSRQTFNRIRSKILPVVPSDCAAFDADIRETFTGFQFGENGFIGRTVKERADNVENTLPHGRVSAFFVTF